MTWYLVNGDVYMEHRFLKKTLKLEEGRIFVLPPDTSPEEGAHIYNAAGKKIVPGFIDVHTHGAVGVDVNAATAEDYEKNLPVSQQEMEPPPGCALCLRIQRNRPAAVLMSSKNTSKWNKKEPIFWASIWKARFCPASIKALCRSIFCRRRIFLF